MNKFNGRKMKTQIKTVFVALLLTTLLSNVLVAQGLTHTTKTYEKSSGDCEGVPCLELKLSYPEFKGSNTVLVSNLQKEVNDFILASMEGEPYKSISQMEQALLEMRKEDETAAGYGLERNLTVLFATDTLMVFDMNGYEYFGGAHPNSFVIYKNYNLISNKEVTVLDYVIKGKMKQFRKLVEKKLRAAYKIKANQSLSDELGWFENKFVLPANMAFTANGIRCIYNQYEVAPYAAGTFEFEIPKKDLVGIVKSW